MTKAMTWRILSAWLRSMETAKESLNHQGALNHSVSFEMRLVDADLTLCYLKEHPLQQLAC